MDSFGIQGLTVFLSSFNKLFDMVRIIDPVKKMVIYYDRGRKHNQELICYEFWKTGSKCSNCVTAQAISKKETFVKVEKRGDRAVMFIASPVKFEKDEYIIEMLKDVTETGSTDILDGKSMFEIDAIIGDLKEKAIRDHLTGVYNRGYMHEQLPMEIEKAAFNNKKLSVIMLDIDSFKEINDTYGHIIGDMVIKELCQTVGQEIRKDYDWIARYGGEEFIIVLVDTDREAAYKVSEKIRMDLEDKAIECDNYTIRITVSIGTYTVEPGTKSFPEVLDIVDRNLYKAKNKGKNRTISS